MKIICRLLTLTMYPTTIALVKFTTWITINVKFMWACSSVDEINLENESLIWLESVPRIFKVSWNQLESDWRVWSYQSSIKDSKVLDSTRILAGDSKKIPTKRLNPWCSESRRKNNNNIPFCTRYRIEVDMANWGFAKNELEKRLAKE